MQRERTIPVVHHFTPIHKIGFPEGIACWCGASLEFKPHEPGTVQKKYQFMRKHESCEAVLPGHKEQSA